MTRAGQRSGLVLLGALLVGSCTLVGFPEETPPVTPSGSSTPASPPTNGDPIDAIPEDLASIPDAVPQQEYKSRYGNPTSYVEFGVRYFVLETSEGYEEEGMASWYGPGFHGNRTSSGETYDQYRMTAAHTVLPLPTYVEVTNLNNGRTVVVKVNDRGPFHDGRIIDLSYTAAMKLGIVQAGTAPVRVKALPPPAIDPGGL